MQKIKGNQITFISCLVKGGDSIIKRSFVFEEKHFYNFVVDHIRSIMRNGGHTPKHKSTLKYK